MSDSLSDSFNLLTEYSELNKGPKHTHLAI